MEEKKMGIAQKEGDFYETQRNVEAVLDAGRT